MRPPYSTTITTFWNPNSGFHDDFQGRGFVRQHGLRNDNDLEVRLLLLLIAGV